MNLSKEDIENYREYIRKVCGLTIPDDKVYLIEQRLGNLVKTSGCENFAQFFSKLVQSEEGYFREKVIAAITTNETSFFRDDHVFEAFQIVILPWLVDLIKKRPVCQISRRCPRVRIWSAGASSGQEPYSIAMLIREYLSSQPSPGICPGDIGLLASDISTSVLAKAIAAEYTSSDVARGLSDAFKKKYFQPSGTKWHLRETVKSMVEFRKINLMEPFSLLGCFDVIFCRNVLIYFNEETKAGIIDQFHRMLSPGGYLILGSSEMLLHAAGKFSSNHKGQTILYQKVA